MASEESKILRNDYFSIRLEIYELVKLQVDKLIKIKVN